MRVLYIDLDCCRADHLGCNGYHRNTSPNVDRVAAEGVTFTHAYCANSPCLPSRASLFSGLFGIRNGVVAHHGVGEQFRSPSRGHWRDPNRPMLAQHLWWNGMKTVSFSCFADRHNAWWFSAGWQELYTFTRKRGQETADEVNAAALPWVQAHGKEDNWFLHVHYWDIHSHYRVPAEWPAKFGEDPPPNWPDQETIDAHQAIYGPRTARDLYANYESQPTGGYRAPVACMPDAISTVADFRMLIDGYDGSIAYADHHVGQILDALADVGVLDETAVVVSGDHGDSFGEHGQYMDHGIANEAVHNIPMVVRWPSVTRPSRCDAMIYGMDLCPTLSEMLGYETPSGWDGRSFAPALRGEQFSGWPYQVWDHGIYTFRRSVRTPEWLLINVLHPGLYPYDAPCFLHDVRSDPHQQVNLADERPDVLAELRNLLFEWREEQIRKGASPDPLEQMIKTEPFLYYSPERMFERLQRTGRGDKVEELKGRLRRYGWEG